MTKKINRTYVSVEENNKALAEGYKYYVEGEWKISAGTDPWSGMPNTTGTTTFFTDLEEAKAFAEKQTWVFNKDCHGTVVTIERKLTLEEKRALEEARKNARAEKRAKKEVEKAEAMGMTIEEYKAYKKTEANKKRFAREIEEAEEEIARLKKAIAWKKAYIEKN